MLTIGLEEHYLSKEFKEDYPRGINGKGLNADIDVLVDVSEGRLKEMDENGMTFQVLSHGLYPATTEDISRIVKANNELGEVIHRFPQRFAGFAALPMKDGTVAAQELRRTVNEFGFKGALINGTFDGDFLDHPRFDDLFKEAEALDVPIYLHPAYPPEAVKDIYYKGNFDPWVGDGLSTTAGGWHFEVGLHVLRLICAGVFDKYPKLKIIIGHLGESIPFFWERIQFWLEPRTTNLKYPVTDYFKSNIWVTTSGYSTNPAFELALKTFGPDRILFSVDYPYSPMGPAIKFINNIDVDDITKEKIAWRNAAELMNIQI